jgi:hypothetical protein
MLMQLMVGGVAGLGVVIKFYGRAVWAFLTGNHDL